MTPLESSEVTLKVVASPTIVILTTPEVSFIFPEDIYSPGVHDDRHLWLSCFYSTGHVDKHSSLFVPGASNKKIKTSAPCLWCLPIGGQINSRLQYKMFPWC